MKKNIHQLKKPHEKAVGEAFIQWYNTEFKTDFRFYGMPDQAPDLHYKSNDQDLFIEVGAAYYDEEHAQNLWENAAGVPTATKSWSGINFNDSLIKNINEQLIKKCSKAYGSSCVLLINLNPNLTQISDIQARLSQIDIPKNNPFTNIYLIGYFPENSSGEPSGYKVFSIS